MIQGSQGNCYTLMLSILQETWQCPHFKYGESKQMLLRIAIYAK